MGLSRLGQIATEVLLMVGVPVAAVHQITGSAPWWTIVLAAAGAVLIRATRKPLKRRLDQLGEACDRLLSRQTTRYRRRYRAYMRASLRRLDSKGLATVGPFTPELCDVYVDVGLTPRAPGEIPTGALPQDSPGPEGKRSLHEFLDRERAVVLAVLGGPGSGKTTVLRRMAFQAAEVKRGRRRQTPVLLALRDHASAVAGDPELTLPVLLRSVMPDKGIVEPAGWWAKRLRDGDCLILLDGLDEIARAENRAAVSAWIELQISLYPYNDYVVTSRPLGYEKTRIGGADVLWVRPFTDDQVTRFLGNWYLATERRATGSTGPDVTLAAAQNAADLLERLAAAPALYELTVNPLLLTMIANVHRYRNALPGSRAELYGEICQVMLYRRQEAKKQQPAVEIPGPDKETLLALVAYTMMTRRVRDLTRADLLDLLRPHVARFPGAVACEAFLADVVDNGLLVEREHHLYAFAHHTFGEFLAARHIVTAGQCEVLVGNVDDAWWRETTLLYLAQPGIDADPIVRACLSARSLTAIALAFAAAAGRPLAPDLRRRLDDMHALAFRPDADPTHRRLIAGVLATETLSQWITTPDGTHVCPRPVTADLYTLFVRDTGNPPPEGALPSVPSQVVTGVWGSDVQAFATWLNDLMISVPLYRLPTPGEARHLLRKSPTRAVWTLEDPDSAPALWHPDERAAVHLVTGADLRDAVETDARTTDVLEALAWADIRAAAVALVLAVDRSGPELLDLATDLVHALSLVRELIDALEQAGDLILGHLPELVRALEPAMGRIHDLDHDLGLDLVRALRVAPARGRALVPQSTLEHALGLFPEFGRLRDSAMGAAVMTVLATTGSGRGSGERRRARFARALLDKAGVPETARFAVDLDTLAAKVPVLADGKPGATTWAVTVAQRFAAAVVPVLERRHTPAGDGWAALRLPALVLAAECDSLGGSSAGDDFRALAAGITLLQQRADDRPRPETILLARR